MGFFGGLIRGFGRALGRGVEWLGEKTGISFLESAGQAIQDACRTTSQRTGQTRGYDQNTATEGETAKIADILSGFSSGLKGQAKMIEQQSKQEVESYFNQLTASMKTALGDVAAVRNIQSQKQLIVQGIDGKLTNVLAQRVSLADQECLNILKMRAGAEKEQKMEMFGRKVINEGLASLCNSLESAFSSVCRSIEEEINALAEQEKKDLQSLADQLREISNKRMKNASSKEETMLLPAQTLAASELILELVNGKGAV